MRKLLVISLLMFGCGGSAHDPMQPPGSDPGPGPGGAADDPSSPVTSVPPGDTGGTSGGTTSRGGTTTGSGGTSGGSGDVDGGTPSPSPGPTMVSFSRDVVPIFARRGCQSCHSGNGIGKDLGNLTLDGSTKLIYRELTVEISPNYGVVRVDLKSPADSLVLVLPTTGAPAHHPVQVFADASDADYQTILRWIEQGAKQN